VNNAPFAGGDIVYINDTIDSKKKSFILGFEPKYAILNFYIQIYDNMWKYLGSCTVSEEINWLGKTSIMFYTDDIAVQFNDISFQEDGMFKMKALVIDQYTDYSNIYVQGVVLG
jgi:hypothetical protein